MQHNGLIYGNLYTSMPVEYMYSFVIDKKSGKCKLIDAVTPPCQPSWYISDAEHDGNNDESVHNRNDITNYNTVGLTKHPYRLKPYECFKPSPAH